VNLRSVVRRFVPLQLRQEIKHTQRIIKDQIGGIHFQKSYGRFTTSSPIQIIQPIIQTSYYQSKLQNILRGCELLSEGTIESQRHWSFWSRIGRPTKSNGFAMGRNLVNGQLTLQIGGGLCQLTSMIYHLALVGGIEIIERHPHSLDIYAEHLRFTPLGADATVVWGFKDLRLYNPHEFPLAFRLAIRDNVLIGELHAPHSIKCIEVAFNRTAINKKSTLVQTVVNDLVVSTDIYEHKLFN
jgi:vancomycin resistance protein VanW